MKINCIYCKSDFITNDEILVNEKFIVRCGHCEKEWYYENELTGLEKRVHELANELQRNENRLNDEKKYNLKKINELETELKNKKIELDQQKLLEDKLYIYEKRLTKSEKENSEQAILEDKIFKLREEIEENSSEILKRGKEIDRRTNNLMMKVNTENKLTPKLKKMNEKIVNQEFSSKKIDNEINTKSKKYKFWTT